MGSKALTDEEALQRFLLDIGCLDELLPWTGKFNLFDVLKISRAEIRHDSIDNIIYISYLSDCELFMLEKMEVHGERIIQENLLSLTTIENHNGMSVCTDFKFLDLES